jgi:hypothetical protein
MRYNGALPIVPLLTFVLGIGATIIGRLPSGQQPPPASASLRFAAVPGAISSQELIGLYDAVQGWPKHISALAGNGEVDVTAQETAFRRKPVWGNHWEEA